MSRQIRCRVACLAILLGTGFLFMPSPAHADMQFELASGTGPYTGTVLTDTSNTGVLTFVGGVGGIAVNATTGTSSSPLTSSGRLGAVVSKGSLGVGSTQGLSSDWRKTF
jgi:hypothetical protein